MVRHFLKHETFFWKLK